MGKALVRLNASRYKAVKASDSTIIILADFLTHCVRFTNGDKIKEWIKDSSSMDLGWWELHLEKDDEVEGMIAMYYGYFLVPEHYFDISNENLIKVIDAWQELCKSRPKEIIIKQDKMGIYLEGVNRDIFPEVAIWLLQNNVRYEHARSSNEQLYQLGRFLSHDFSYTLYSDIFDFKKWIEDDIQKLFKDKWLILEKKEDDNISIFLNIRPFTEKDAFIIKKNKLLALLDDFERLVKIRTKRIVIIQKDDEFIVQEDII